MIASGLLAQHESQTLYQLLQSPVWNEDSGVTCAEPCVERGQWRYMCGALCGTGTVALHVRSPVWNGDSGVTCAEPCVERGQWRYTCGALCGTGKVVLHVQGPVWNGDTHWTS